MKIQQHTYRPIFDKTKAALLTGALLLTLLPGCAADTSAPVVTEDDLTPSSTVQDVIAGMADNGKTYPYVWYAEDPDLAVSAYLAEAVEAAADEQEQEVAEKAAEQLREELAKELQLDPVVTAQEAANRAGQTFEELYGLDLTGGTIYLRCRVRSSEEESRQAMGPEPERMLWEVRFGAEGDASHSADVSHTVGRLDATTGEWISLHYTASTEERQAWEATPQSVCFRPSPKYPESPGAGSWDTGRAEFAALSGAIERRAAEAISGSILIGGAQVAEVRQEIIEQPGGQRMISLALQCDNGKSYTLYQYDSSLYYPEYDSGYPLRSYQFYLNPDAA